MFYGSYIYLHERLAPRYRTEVVPGVTSFSAAAASAGIPLARRDEVLTILPGRCPPRPSRRCFATTDVAVVIKLGPQLRQGARRRPPRGGRRARDLRRAREFAGRAAARARRRERGHGPVHVARARARGGPTAPRAGERPARGRGARARRARLADARGARGAVARRRARRLRALPRARARAARPGTAGQRQPRRARARPRGARARAGGSSVAVVSSGDPGIFAMAAAVTRRSRRRRALRGVPVRVVPGVSAMQAAAARAGAPLGHDFCVISLSDQRKPWDVIEARLVAAASADLAIALYNPASQHAPRAARARTRHPARSIARRHARRPGARHRQRRGVADHHDARGLRPRRGRHAHARAGRVLADARPAGRERRRARVHAAQLPRLDDRRRSR